MSSPATSELLQDIRNLAKDTFSIARTFQDTKEKISEVIGLVQHIPVIPIADHTRAKELAEEWSKHGETYTTLVWDSRRVAGNAEAAVKDFTQGILPFVQSDDTSFEDKCIELRNCTEQLEGDERSAAETSQRFSNLKEGVKRTSDAWRSLSQSFRVALETKDQELGVKIQKLDGALMYFNEKIESQTKRIAELSSSSGGSILRFLSPFYWFRRLGNWIDKLQAEKARAASIAERDEINQQLKAAVKERDEYKEKYQQLSRDLLEIDSGFNNIIEKLIVFGRVWAALRADIQSIQLKLSKAGTSRTPQLMGIRLRSTEELYGHLAEALREYQLCVNEEDLRP